MMRLRPPALERSCGTVSLTGPPDLRLAHGPNGSPVGLHLVLDRGALGEDRRGDVADHRPAGGMVAVDEVAVEIIEVGDDHEVVVALVDVRVGADRVRADLRDETGQSGEARLDRDALFGRRLGVPAQQHDVAEHRCSYSNAASTPPSTAVAVPVTYPACSEHRNAAKRPKSAGSPMVPAGMPAAAAPGSPCRALTRSVAWTPGNSELT